MLNAANQVKLISLYIRDSTHSQDQLNCLSP